MAKIKLNFIFYEGGVVMYTIKRNIENIIKNRSLTNKAILLTGPRQVGKSTLI